MKRTCKKCKKKVSILEFTEEQKLDLYVIMQNDLKLFAEKIIIDEFNFDQKEAKIIVEHLNNKNGKCLCCDFLELESEYSECSNCEKFNLNEPVFNMEFCSHLEWNLDFKNIENKNCEHFWCDGIEHIPKNTKSLLSKNIEKDRVIITKAYIGNDGQDIYEMKIKFGEKSIENYKKQISIIECIPEKNTKNWIKINIEKKEIDVELK